MRELWRICLWGTAAAVALIVAVYAGSTDAGVDRARHAVLQLREVVMPSGIKPSRALDAIEGSKLAETVRVLTADRERLIARIAALEHNVDDITSSITRAEKAAQSVAPPPAQLSPPPVMWAVPSPPLVMSAVPSPPPVMPAAPSPPPAMSAVPQTTAPTNPPEDEVTSSTGKPEVPPSESAAPTAPTRAAPNQVTKRQFGIDLGGAPSEDALRALWTSALRRHGVLIENLRPVVLTREHPRGGGVGYRLIAGPIADAAKAARFCAAITASGGVCQPAMYEGQRLAVR
jgi:hypothetical protein